MGCMPCACGPWKLSIAAGKKTEGEGGGKRQRKKGKQAAVAALPEAPQLYNLDDDIGEKSDVAALHPDVVKRLQALIVRMDKDLGKGKDGPGVRAAGHVDNPKPLLMRQPNEYD